MAYRKLEVNGQLYEYTIGTSFVKIKGFEAIPKEKIGTRIFDPTTEIVTYRVTPALVSKYIEQVSR